MIDLDLEADLNTQDDDGNNWTSLSWAVDPSLVKSGAILRAGRQHAWSWVRILDVSDDGFVTFEQVESNEAGHSREGFAAAG